MNLNMPSLKKLKLSEFRIFGSRLFHSIMIGRKKVFLKKLYFIFIKGILLAFLVL